MTFELRPPLLESKGLAAAVAELAEEVSLECGFQLDLSLRVNRHPLGTEDLAYRTVKEALTNVRKHAGATEVQVSLVEDDGTLVGLVADDGRGFEVERALDRRRMRLHLGLDTMRERLRLVGGVLEIESVPGSGSRIAFTIPLLDE
jgi:signal transduction histidine kinase